jgi:hypothetical protein
MRPMLFYPDGRQERRKAKLKLRRSPRTPRQIVIERLKNSDEQRE